jgi:hypothetical protein
MSLFRKNVILRGHDIHSIPLSPGLEKKNRFEANNENYATLIGTKQQINTYLQDAPILSERLRTLNDLPRMRVINTTKVMLQ